ncbi:MAG: 4-hydroxythreonine-4-phosphate dehydrogenase PdxA [Hyphomicrobiaceae bacterium]|nr:4-hydroxythreonine-4-phosphate dehydrogenase PdxA [Hyphomicrobiaceae bacterium]
MPGAVGGRSGAALALTMGDPAGVGLELTITAWQRRVSEGLAPFAYFGSAEAIADRAAALGQVIDIVRIASPSEAAGVFGRALPVIDMALPAPAVAGVADPSNGAVVIASIEKAVAAVAAGEAAAVVTNPIAKSVLYRAGFAHPGHTEFLASLARAHYPGSAADPVMMIASDALNVVPLTIHIPLAEVPAAISSEMIERTLRIMAASLSREFGFAHPRIAVAGLNPHAGEDGSIGLEDRDVIAPVIAKLAAEGLHVTGPHAADTLFHPAARATYDAVLAMYHDQALIPVKTLAFDTGVNVTLGLPFVRTSPDHGTAFDIAGKGRASASSLIAALKLAQRMSERRSAAAANAPL